MPTKEQIDQHTKNSEDLIHQEIKDAALKHKDSPPEDLVEALIQIQLFRSIPKLLQTLRGFGTSGLSNPSHRLIAAEIIATAELIEGEIVQLQTLIVNGLEKVIQQLRTNPNNIREVLTDICSAIDLLGPKEDMAIELQRAAYNVNQDIGQPIFTHADLEESNKQGFEEGYATALKTTRNSTIKGRAYAVDVI